MEQKDVMRLAKAVKVTFVDGKEVTFTDARMVWDGDLLEIWSGYPADSQRVRAVIQKGQVRMIETDELGSVPF
jgi:hypothetical protein